MRVQLDDVHRGFQRATDIVDELEHIGNLQMEMPDQPQPAAAASAAPSAASSAGNESPSSGLSDGWTIPPNSGTEPVDPTADDTSGTEPNGVQSTAGTNPIVTPADPPLLEHC